MNHIDDIRDVKYINYCQAHAQYSPHKIYAGDEVYYASPEDCPICPKMLDIPMKQVEVRRPKKMVEIFKEIDVVDDVVIKDQE